MPIFRAGLPILKRLAGALLSPGTFRPQVTTTNAKGETIVVEEEHVEGRGILRDGTIRVSLMGIAGSYVALKGYWAGGLTAEELASEGFWASVGTMGASLGAVWFHIRSWMPLRGSAPPVPTP